MNFQEYENKQSSSGPHPALLIPEILSSIFRHFIGDYRTGTLAKAAQVCRAFKEPALEALWHSRPSLDCLVHVLSLPSSASHDAQLEDLEKALCLCADHGWAPMISASRRIHEVEMRQGMEPDRFTFKLLSNEWRTEQVEKYLVPDWDMVETFLPNLKAISVDGWSMSALSGKESILVPLLHEKINSIRMMNVIVVGFPPFPDYDGDRRKVFADCVLFAFEHAQKLRALHFTVQYRSHYTWAPLVLRDHMAILDSYLNEYIPKCLNLVAVRVAPDDELLRALSYLPSLTTLTIELAYLDRMHTDDSKRSPKNVSSDQPFPVLENLTVNCLSSLPDVAAFLEETPCFARNSITLDIAGEYDSHALKPVIQALIDPATSTHLDTFTLYLDIDVRENDELLLQWDSFSPLLSCHDLRVLDVQSAAVRPTLSTPVLFAGKKLAAPWPKVRFFAFDYELFAGFLVEQMGLFLITYTKGPGAE